MNDLIKRYSSLEDSKGDIESTLRVLTEAYESGGKLLLCGNGGSAADCDHIVGELMKGFMNKRPLSEEKKADMRRLCPDLGDATLDSLQLGLPAIALHSSVAYSTAYSNDVSAELVYAQAVLSLGRSGDALLAISTSGNSENVIRAAEIARALGISVVGLTGRKGGRLKEVADVCICVPESETYKIQELHLPVYHYLCAELEKHFFGR